MDEKLIYEFSKNEKLLRQYYRLRKIIYDIELGISIPLHNDYFDSISETLIVRNKQKCIGGVRVTVCEPNSNIMLPTEDDEFRLEELLPELNLHSNTYAEFSRLALLPDYRDTTVTDAMYKHLNRKAKQRGVRYVFVITDLLHARLYMRSYRRLGFKVRLMSHINIPISIKLKYDNVVECIIMLDLTTKLSQAPVESVENIIELRN
jgi:hypothetical protein